MKCFYYLSPTLADTEHVSDDLHKSGVDDWFIHIISKNEEGLSRLRLHSGNYLETLDVLREGLIGVVLGFLVGLVVAGLFSVFEPFGPDRHGGPGQESDLPWLESVGREQGDGPLIR